MRFAGEQPVDEIIRFHSEYNKVPSFGVDPLQTGLEIIVPGAIDKLYKDMRDPLKKSNVEQFLFQRLIEPENPRPLT
jgi:hypothetical protein